MQLNVDIASRWRASACVSGQGTFGISSFNDLLNLLMNVLPDGLAFPA